MMAVSTVTLPCGGTAYAAREDSEPHSSHLDWQRSSIVASEDIMDSHLLGVNLRGYYPLYLIE
jgi:hypothetical protein